MTEHVERQAVYFRVFFALMVLTGLTVWVSYLDLGDLSVAVALLIAATKALLVILFFMHVRHSPALTQAAVGAGILWLIILLVLTLSDYYSREWLPAPSGW